MIGSVPMLLGHYRPIDSFLHRLDARSKLVPILMVMVLGLLTDSLLFYVIVLAVLFAALLSSGVTLRVIAVNFRPILILVGITFLYHVVFSGRDAPTLVTIFGFALTGEGLVQACFFSLRLLLFVGVVFLVTLTSSPSELAEAAARLLRPLRKIRVPVDDIGLVLFIAIRFIPVLHQEFLAIRNAQLIRGVNFEGGLLRRARKITAIFVPVLVAAMSRADELALAMEARGYRSGTPRTFYSRARFGLGATVFALGSTLILGLVFYLTNR